MKILAVLLSVSVAVLAIGCATPPPPGSIDEAVNNAWDRLCKSGYCEGHHGSIIKRTDRSLTVFINGHTRYITYNVAGIPGNYVVLMEPTADGGRAKP